MVYFMPTFRIPFLFSYHSPLSALSLKRVSVVVFCNILDKSFHKVTPPFIANLFYAKTTRRYASTVLLPDFSNDKKLNLSSFELSIERNASSPKYTPNEDASGDTSFPDALTATTTTKPSQIKIEKQKKKEQAKNPRNFLKQQEKDTFLISHLFDVASLEAGFSRKDFNSLKTSREKKHFLMRHASSLWSNFSCRTALDEFRHDCFFLLNHSAVEQLKNIFVKHRHNKAPFTFAVRFQFIQKCFNIFPDDCKQHFLRNFLKCMDIIEISDLVASKEKEDEDALNMHLALPFPQSLQEDFTTYNINKSYLNDAAFSSSRFHTENQNFTRPPMPKLSIEWEFSPLPAEEKAFQERSILLINVPVGPKEEIEKALREAFQHCGKFASLTIFDGCLQLYAPKKQPRTSSLIFSSRISPVVAFAEFESPQQKLIACQGGLRSFGVFCKDRLVYPEPVEFRNSLIVERIPAPLSVQDLARILAFELIVQGEGTRCCVRTVEEDPPSSACVSFHVEATSKAPFPVVTHPVVSSRSALSGRKFPSTSSEVMEEFSLSMALLNTAYAETRFPLYRFPSHAVFPPPPFSPARRSFLPNTSACLEAPPSPRPAFFSDFSTRASAPVAISTATPSPPFLCVAPLDASTLLIEAPLHALGGWKEAGRAMPPFPPAFRWPTDYHPSMDASPILSSSSTTFAVLPLREKDPLDPFFRLPNDRKLKKNFLRKHMSARSSLLSSPVISSSSPQTNSSSSLQTNSLSSSSVISSSPSVISSPSSNSLLLTFSSCFAAFKALQRLETSNLKQFRISIGFPAVRCIWREGQFEEEIYYNRFKRR